MNITWTEEEKKQLLEALEQNGVNNLEALARSIPTKTISDIEYAIHLYERKSISALKDKELPRNREAALDKWLFFVKEISKDSHKTADLVTAIKFMALFEAANPNMRAAYEYIADLMTGAAPKPIDNETMNFMSAAFKKLALHLKRNVKKETDFLNALTVDAILQKSYKSKKILSDPVFNSLKVPVKLLIMEEDALI